jgi:hypothetical protein
MVEIGRVRVKTGNAPIEQKISAYPAQADICAFVSTSLETKRAARRPSQGSGRPNANGRGWLRTALGQKRRFDPQRVTSGLPQSTDIARPARLVRFVHRSGSRHAHSITLPVRASGDRCCGTSTHSRSLGAQRLETRVASGPINVPDKVVGRAIAIRMQMQIEDSDHNTKMYRRP